MTQKGSPIAHYWCAISTLWIQKGVVVKPMDFGTVCTGHCNTDLKVPTKIKRVGDSKDINCPQKLYMQCWRLLRWVRRRNRIRPNHVLKGLNYLHRIRLRVSRGLYSQIYFIHPSIHPRYCRLLRILTIWHWKNLVDEVIRIREHVLPPILINPIPKTLNYRATSSS